ncbi:peptidoglycan recognition protein family protein [Fusibacter ferrireducens]|uniref:N-acetylmuramoyl-L-alanine amidase n=1 Tax=Fusibacter ferrireducens TaxID=2785058 RepID=A0ABR9ZUQ4_9FIRM|nr:N-acetylmuramoyl-L-alanine amidase [Fusibacter ferrireducens]MBF4693888.1 N-acetylmuramoyl-L-alanine amidase [Fusibacter ferrireducens]
MLNKLKIIGGVIQNKEINSIPLITQIVTPSGNHNVRTQMPLELETALGITNHNTGNTAPTASANMHAKWMQNVENADETYVGAHLFVDEKSIIQVLPINEVAYHAGDGKGNGNMKTIAVEICENGNILKAEEHAKQLNAALILTYPHFKIYKHQDWSGKYCPRVILGRKSWDAFVEDIQKYVAEATLEMASNVKSDSNLNSVSESESIESERELDSENHPIEAWKLKGIHFAIEEGLITDYNYWRDRLDDEMPAWAHFIIMEKVVEKLRDEMASILEEKLDEIYREAQ